MATTSDTDRKVRLWEQHGQSILLAVITGVLFYCGNALIDAKAAQATMSSEIKAMAAQVARLEGSVTAMQSNFVTRPEFGVHEQRLQTLERGRRP
jgi:outer membrane murein-binding lipoprotein Lpp